MAEDFIRYKWREETLNSYADDPELQQMFKEIFIEHDQKEINNPNNNKMTYEQEKELYELRKFKAEHEREKEAATKAAEEQKQLERERSKMDPYSRRLLEQIEQQLTEPNKG